MSKALIIRTCKPDLTSYSNKANGFKWPASGPVYCPDWDPKPECGNGLHGLLWGKGDWSYLSGNSDAIWQVVEVEESECIWIDNNKVKFPRGSVIFSGRIAEAVTKVLCDPQAMKGANQASSGYSSKAASSGKSSTAASSGDYSTAASSGYYSKAASSGYYSTAASSGDSSKAASSGDSSKAASSGDSSKAASSGDRSTAEAKGKHTIAMASGLCCTLSAGENGCFASAWYDEKHKRNRIKVGYVGRHGIKPNTPYRLTTDGQWEEVK